MVTTDTAEPVDLPPTRVRLPRPVRDFLHTQTASGIVLLAGAIAALVWANSPWQESYDSFWHTALTVQVGPITIVEDLRHWVNDALMAIFFFVVGLEIKRELVVGELRSWRRASLPVVAALGGMVVPALIYTAVNAGHPGAAGWGVPMATDIAFAVGVMALLGSRVPSSLKIFLLSLAIADDIGAIVVIAVFYTSSIESQALLAAAGLLAAMFGLRAARVVALTPYILLGTGVWLAVFQSGVHATIAGVVLGLLAPSKPLASPAAARGVAQVLGDDPSPEQVRSVTTSAANTVSVLHRLEYRLHPYASFIIVPVFALANAGVSIDPAAVQGAAASRVAIGVAVGLVMGKPVGVAAFSWLAVRLGLAALPPSVRWPQLLGAGTLAGVGFTVSLFITELAFQGRLAAAAKLAILGASATAAVAGAALLWATTRPKAGAAGAQE